MTLPSSAIIIIVVIAFATYLIYSQNQNQYPNMMYYQQMPHMRTKNPPCQNCARTGNAVPPNSQLPHAMHSPQSSQSLQSPQSPQLPSLPGQGTQPTVTNITIDGNEDPFSDAIKRQDLYTMYDPLTYPQLRLPREVLDRYNEHYERTGTYPPFNQATQPYLFDNPILNGVLIKICEENEPFSNNVPNSVPLFRVRSAKNANRYFYYILDQRYLSKIEPKIALDHVRVNGIYYPNADFYGIPELFDGDVIENISIFPGANFRVSLYKSYHFP
jgi:hypothetical protein